MIIAFPVISLEAAAPMFLMFFPVHDDGFL